MNNANFITWDLLEIVDGDIQCLSPAKKYKLYKSSINKSIHFAQRRLSNSTRVQVQRVTAQLNLSRDIQCLSPAKNRRVRPSQSPVPSPWNQSGNIKTVPVPGKKT